MYSERWPGNVLLGTQSDTTPSFLNLLSRPIENAIAFDHYQSGLNVRERPPGWSFLKHPSLLSWEFIPTWWIGRIYLASNARIGLLLCCIFSSSLFFPLSSLSSLSFFFFIIYRPHFGDTEFSWKSEREMGQISCPKLPRKLLYDYKYTCAMEDLWLQQVSLLIN